MENSKLLESMPTLEEHNQVKYPTAKLAIRGVVLCVFVSSLTIAYNAVTTSEMDRLEEDLQVTQDDINKLVTEEETARNMMNEKKLAKQAKEILHHNRKCVLASLKLEKKMEVSESTRTECFLQGVQVQSPIQN
jgi:uncharacterized membrane protein (DUF106 family)